MAQNVSTGAPAPVAGVGIELADSGTRLTATLDPRPEARRWHARLPAPPTPSEALDALVALVERAVRESGLHALDRAGVAVWGQVERRRGVVRELRQAVGWEAYPLAERLGERLGAPVRLDTATNTAALAEVALGAGMGSAAALYVALGRSVASAYVADGRILSGAHGQAGGLAHWRVAPDGPRCSCGARGHLEPLASAQSLVRNTIGRASGSDASYAALMRVTHGRAEALTAAQVAQLAGAGDPAARASLDDALDALAPALAFAVTLLDPDRIVIGGALTAAGSTFLDPLRARISALRAPFDIPPLVAGALDPLAPLLGARLLARGDRDA